jgi:hypothetical protein
MKLASNFLVTILNLKRKSRISCLLVLFAFIHFAAARSDGFTTGPILCPFRLITGHPCPTCGTTRSIAAIVDGRFLDSLLLNPLGIVIVGFLFLWGFDVGKYLPEYTSPLRRIFQVNSRLGTSFLVFIFGLAWVINFSRW